MPLNGDISTALQLLEHIQHTIDVSDDAKLQAQTSDDLSLLIAVLENPVFRSIVSIQDSLSELNQQMQQHPSILPVDFDITSCGDLVLNVPPPADVYDPLYQPDYKISEEFDDQRVPVAKLSNSSSGESPSPQLYKPDGSSLGFSVVGLRSEEKGELGIFVQEIQTTGIAGRDGRLHEGDQILAIDGQPLDSNISHQQAISILQQARGLVELVVARSEEEVPPASPTPSLADRSPSAVSDTSKAGSDMVLNTEWAQVEVIDLINDGSGLGFGIIGGRSTGVVVKTILPGGVADRDNRLQSGDHILQIGEVNLRGMGSEQVAAVLRQSGSHVRLVVARPVEPTSPDYQALGSHAPIVPTKILGDPEELDRHLLQNGYPETFNTHPNIHDSYSSQFIFGQQDSDIELHPELGLVVDVVRNPQPIHAAKLMSTAPSLPILTMGMLDSETLPEVDEFTVNLRKDYHGLGITIAGYVCEKEELSGIFVKSISEGSAADLCKQIQVNDRIVEVDNRSLQGYTNHQAVEVLRSTNQAVRLRLERYLRGPKYEQLQQAIAASEMRPPTPSSPSAASLPRFPISTDGDEEIEMEGESHTTIDSMILETVEASNADVQLYDVEMLIDSSYDGALAPTVEAAIQAKWGKIMANPEIEIVVAQLSKLSEGGGLGISLEGTVDVEDGQEVRPHHYIRSILPEGPVGTNGRLRSGDELLEVNGHRLLGMNHIEVVTILKDLPVSVRMVCARRPGELAPYRLIDTSQDRAAFAARSILGGSLQNLIPASDRLVKAKSDGSLASTTTTATATDASFSKAKSRSLEPLTGLAMWSSEPQMIQLVKGERGLGFSILDYQDPMNSNETVIVIRSLVPGGVAQVDGRLIPGDRLLFVNDTDLENASLDQAVQALKGAVKGAVRIGVAKPLPIPDSISHSQEFLDGLSQATPTLDDHSMFSSSGSLSPSGGDLEQEAGHLTDTEPPPPLPSSQPPDVAQPEDDTLDDTDDSALPKLDVPVSRDRLTAAQASSVGELTDEEMVDEEIAACWASEVHQLPASLEQDVRIHKGAESLGLSVDCVDKGVNGMLVVAVATGGAIYRDKRISPGDFLLSVNNESLRKVTNSQARAILRRAQLLSADISVTFIPGVEATAYRKSLSQVNGRPTPVKQKIQISPSSTFVTKDRKTSPIFDSSKQSNSEFSERVTSSSVNVKLVAVTQLPIEKSEPVAIATSPITYTSVRTLDVPSPATVSASDTVSPVPAPASATVVPSVRRLSPQEDKVFVSQIQIRTSNISPLQTSPVLAREADEPTMTVLQQVQGYSGEHDAMDEEAPSVLLAKHWGPERTVEILREPNCSLGISIVGGKVDLYNAGPDSGSAISGIFIKNVLPESPAGRTAELKTGDRILEVDGIDLRQASHERAVDVIRAAGNPVSFLVQSLIQWNVGDRESQSHEVASASSAGAAGVAGRRTAPPAPTPGELMRVVPMHVPEARTVTPEIIQAGRCMDAVEAKPANRQSRKYSINKNKAPPPLPPTHSLPQQPQIKEEKDDKTYSSSDDDEDEEDVRDLEGRIYTKMGQEIFRASAGNVKRTKEEIEADPEAEDEFGYTKNKVKKKYAPLGESVLMVQLERGLHGLGLSIAGHKDRNRMAVFVVGLNPNGVASKTGSIRVGDEILEVNGVVVQGRCHLNASAIIKGLPGPVFKVILLRRDAAIEELAVKPITQFPVSLDDETPEEKYSNFKGIRSVTIKKGTQGLGIMIIEGKHAEVGQGIFISDIQEGSAAEQAGLIVGDMILSVNKDTLLGSNYDAAASLLKKTEGVVTLVVCNPNKTKEEEKKAESTLTVAGADSKGAPARSPTPTQQRPVSPLPEKPHLPPNKPNLTATTPPPSPATPVVSPAAPVASPAAPVASPLPPGDLAATEEPVADPLTCEIVPGKETSIEIFREKLPLGLNIVGGSDTLMGIVLIQEVFPDGAATKDSRLKPGDQILDVNTVDFRSIAHTKAVSTLRQTPAKVKMVVLRDEGQAKGEDVLETFEVELTKKAGKGLGLSLVGYKASKGVHIADVIPSGVADADGRLMKGDQILSVNGQDLKLASEADAAAVLKTVSGKVAIKLGRLRTGSRRTSTANTARESGNDQDSVVPQTVGAEHAPITTSQSFPRYVSKRESLIRQFTNWSFRRRNI